MVNGSSNSPDMSMIELFKTELEIHTRKIEENLLKLEDQGNERDIEPVMRAAHSIKGAARIVGLDIPVKLAHSMESLLTSIEQVDRQQIDLLLRCNDLLTKAAQYSDEELVDFFAEKDSEIINLVNELEGKSSTNGNTSDAIKEQDIDENAFELFKSDIDKNSRIIEGILINASGAITQAEKKRLRKSAASIRSTSKMLKLDNLVRLASMIEQFFNAYEKDVVTLDKEASDVLLRSNDVFSSLNDLEPIEILQTIKDEDSIIEDYCKELNLIISQKKNTVQAEEIQKSNDALIDLDMLSMFKSELVKYSEIIDKELQDDSNVEDTSSISRAAHSIKGAAKIVGVEKIFELAKEMEDAISELTEPDKPIKKEAVKVFREINEIFKRMAATGVQDMLLELENSADEISDYCKKLNDFIDKDISLSEETPSAEKTSADDKKEEPKEKSPQKKKPKQDEVRQEAKFVRVLSEEHSRLLGLAGENLVQTRSLENIIEELYRFKKEITKSRNPLTSYSGNDGNEQNALKIQDFNKLFSEFNSFISVLDKYFRKSELIAERLYNSALETKMKPFSEAVTVFPRLVRDVAKSINKKVKLEISGEDTKIDSDIIDILEAPLNHLIRNAIDHGIEAPEERVKAGKSETGLLQLNARHSAGMLLISIKDDGKGINKEKLKNKIVEKGYSTREMLEKMSDTELFEFLFLPGFSTAPSITEISGRGVGLDVVFNVVHETGGIIRTVSNEGTGTEFILQLPVTLSVVRSMLFSINNELYALPLSRIERIFKINRSDVQKQEGKEYYKYNDENIGIVDANQVLSLKAVPNESDKLNLIILSDRMEKYALYVDKFISMNDLVVIKLNKKLGKIPNISSGAILEDGSPILILDPDDLVKNIEQLIKDDAVRSSLREVASKGNVRPKQVLIVDDSLTVREVERKILEKHNYEVQVAVDGIDGWNKAHMSKFDLIISDIDMPRMNGFDLVKRIKSDTKLMNIPIMIVSYKEREEDKIRGLEAGADHYLTKSSFHDDTLINAVKDLIGDAF